MLEINKIYNIDCAEGMSKLDDESVDLVVTSPPYDNIRQYNGFVFDVDKIIFQLYRVIKNGGVVVWVIGDQTLNGSESCTSFKQALKFVETGFNLHDTMIYHKQNYIPLNHNRYEQSFEYMFVFSKGKPKTFNPIMIPCKNSGKLERYAPDRRKKIDSQQSMRVYNEEVWKETKETKIHPNIFTYTIGKSKTGHPAPFPDDLANDMIISWSNKGDIVLDPFIGSGTTALECIKTQRNYIGFDISNDYCKMSETRIREYTSGRLF